MLQYPTLALGVVLAGGFQLLHIVIVDVEHGIVVHQHGIAALMGIEHQRLAVVVRQAVVDRIV